MQLVEPQTREGLDSGLAYQNRSVSKGEQLLSRGAVCNRDIDNRFEPWVKARFGSFHQNSLPEVFNLSFVF